MIKCMNGIFDDTFYDDYFLILKLQIVLFKREYIHIHLLLICINLVLQIKSNLDLPNGAIF